MPRLLFACLSYCLMHTALLTAEEVGERKAAPWLQPQVLKASMDIKMTVTQQGIFREAVGGFLDSLTGEYISMLKQQKDEFRAELNRPGVDTLVQWIGSCAPRSTTHNTTVICCIAPCY